MGVAAAALALALAGCGSSGKSKLATTSTTSSAASESTTSTVAPPTTTTGPLSPSLPAPATSGALTISATVPMPLGLGTPIAAEAPDGAVFVAEVGTPVYVIDGDQPAIVAEHVAGGARALAADATNLYAATYTAATTTVFSYNRSTGTEIHAWTLPGINSANASNDKLIALTSAGGGLWAAIVDGNDVNVYRITPTSSAVASLVATSVGEAAIGPDGSVYYTSSGARLMRRAPAGQVTVGPALVDSPNSEGGGVQYIDTVAAGLLWVDEPAGQGLDAEYSTFDLVTLAAVGGPYPGNLSESAITDTLAGPLVLTGGNATSACPEEGTLSVPCVFRFSATATLSDGTAVGAVYTLLGPYPAVITTAANTALQLDRLS